MKDIAVRLGWRHNKWVIVIRDYDGPNKVCPELFAAIHQQLLTQCVSRKTEPMTEFDHVEIL